MRRVGAAGRQMLVAAAARNLERAGVGMPHRRPAWCITRQAGARSRYGALAAKAATLPAPDLDDASR